MFHQQPFLAAVLVHRDCMCTWLLALFCDSTVTFPSIPGRDLASTYLSPLLPGGPLPPVDHPSKAHAEYFSTLCGFS